MALSSYFEIPVIRPTAEELQDFSSLIERHLEVFRAAGLIKIIPPPNWATNLPTEKDAFSFTVNKPIRQELKGSQGVWETANVEQKSLTVPEFKKQAETQGKEVEAKTPAERERIFWKNMGRFPATYGADNPGSLFEKTGCSWNFGNIRSLLTYLDRDLPGINNAYLYFGMWKALFAWHSEDLDLYSVNYVHFGYPKEWYCIRPKDKLRFETYAASMFAAQAQSCSQFLRHKLSVISLQKLEKAGFEVGHVVQEAGEFIVTFPAAYHMGFNHGWNCAESVNFALPSWLEYGKRARVCRCQPDSVRFDVVGLERRWLQETGQAPKPDGASDEQWSFTCRCQPDWHGTDRMVDQPTGHLFQCSGCSWWSHVDCYPRYADRDPVDLPLQMYCLKCRPLPTSKRTSNDNAPQPKEGAPAASAQQKRRRPTKAKAEPDAKPPLAEAPPLPVASAAVVRPPSPLPSAPTPLKTELISAPPPPAPTPAAASVSAPPHSLVFAALPPSLPMGMHVPPLLPLPAELFDASVSAAPPSMYPLSFPLPFVQMEPAYAPAMPFLSPMPLSFAAPPMPQPYLQPPF